MAALGPRLQAGLKLLFFVLVVACFTLAVMPVTDGGEPANFDKVKHFSGFYGLAVIGSIAFPRLNLLILGAGLSAFGAFIEVVQGLPMVGRDKDVWDWVADSFGIALALAPFIAAVWRSDTARLSVGARPLPQRRAPQDAVEVGHARGPVEQLADLPGVGH